MSVAGEETAGAAAPDGAGGDDVARRIERAVREAGPRPVDFGIFYFAGETADEPDKYGFLLESARVADRRGFTSAWLPERHFHGFGGLYPNPSVIAAALAVATERLHLRGGSVVLPLHHAARVAEEWAVVDNLSNGRTGVSFAPGWHPGDFVLAPDAYEERTADLVAGIDQVRRLWAGEELAFPGPGGGDRLVRTFPRPIQPALPHWITASSNPQSFARAGKTGANVLTALIGLSVEELVDRVAVYRKARAAAGLDPAAGIVTVMVHGFMDLDEAGVRAAVLEPLRDYLRSYLAQQRDADLKLPDADDLEIQVEFAAERYLSGSAMLGTPEHCAGAAARLAACDVDEIACLVDFGAAEPRVLESVELMGRFAETWSAQATACVAEAAGDGADGTAGAATPSAEATPADLHERRERLARRLRAASPVEREVVRDALRQRRAAAPEGATERPCGIDQGRLVLVEHEHPSGAGNNVAGGLLFSRVPDPALLRQVLEGVAAAHECLHSRFRIDGGVRGEPVATRVVDPALRPSWEERDVRERMAADPEGLKPLLTEVAGRPFDLVAGPLVRAAFLRTSEEAYCLALVVHHAVTDWVTMNVVVEELLAAYAAAVGARPALGGSGGGDDGQLPRSYTAFAEHERSPAAREQFAEHVAFWREELAGAAEPVTVPYDHEPEEPRRYRGGRQWFALDPETSAAVRALARETRCTPYAVGLAAYAALLARRTGTHDVLVGAPGANREAPGTERTVGLLMTMVVLRTRLEPARPFADAVRTARDSFNRMLAHQSVPYDEVIRDQRPGARLDHLPLFRSRYLYLTWHPPLQLGDLTVNSVDVDPGATFYDGTLALWESPQGFFGRWEYDADRYDEAGASDLAASFCGLLAAAAADPSTPLADLPLAPARDRLLSHAGLTAHLRALTNATAEGTA